MVQKSFVSNMCRCMYNFVFLFFFSCFFCGLWMLDVFTAFKFYGFLFIWPVKGMKRNGTLFQIGIANEWSLLAAYCLLCPFIGLMLDLGWPRLFVTHFDFIVAVYMANVRCATLQFYILFFSLSLRFLMAHSQLIHKTNYFSSSCKYSSAFPCNNLYPAMHSCARNFNRCRIPLIGLRFFFFNGRIEWKSHCI